MIITQVAPDSLENVSLYETVAAYDYEKNMPKRKKDKPDELSPDLFRLKHGLGFFRKRARCTAIVKTQKHNLSTEFGKENFFHSLLMLFKPWRSEDELLMGCATFEAAWKIFRESSTSSFPEQYRQARVRAKMADEIREKMEAEAVAEMQATTGCVLIHNCFTFICFKSLKKFKFKIKV